MYLNNTIISWFIFKVYTISYFHRKTYHDSFPFFWHKCHHTVIILFMKINSIHILKHTKQMALSEMQKNDIKYTVSKLQNKFANIYILYLSWTIIISLLCQHTWIECESLAWPRISSNAGSEIKKNRGNTNLFCSR